MTSRTKAELFLLSITLIWGSTFVITKDALDHVSPFLYTAIRFSLAALIIGILYRKQVGQITSKTFLKGAILGLFLFVGFMLQTVGLLFTTASK
ncbi:MAG: EamA family transporter, partial [Bacteroidota bacterium]